MMFEDPQTSFLELAAQTPDLWLGTPVQPHHRWPARSQPSGTNIYTNTTSRTQNGMREVSKAVQVDDLGDSGGKEEK